MEGNSSGGGSGGEPSGGGPPGGGPPGGRPPESFSPDLTVSEGNKRKEDMDSAINDIKEIAKNRTMKQLSEGKIQPGAEEVSYYNSQLKLVLKDSVKEIAAESNIKFVEVKDYRALWGRIDRIVNQGKNP